MVIANRPCILSMPPVASDAAARRYTPSTNAHQCTTKTSDVFQEESSNPFQNLPQIAHSKSTVLTAVHAWKSPHALDNMAVVV